MQSLNHIKTASDVKAFKDFNDDIIYRDFPSTKPRHLFYLSLSSGVGQKVSGKSSGSTRESSLVSFSCWPVPAGLFESPDAAVEIRHDMNRQFDTSLKFRPALSSEWTARMKYHWGSSSKLFAGFFCNVCSYFQKLKVFILDTQWCCKILSWKLNHFKSNYQLEGRLRWQILTEYSEEFGYWCGDGTLSV